MGEDILQRWIVELLRPLVERWLKAQGTPWFVGADQFIYFEQFNPHRRVSPDVYVLPGVPPDTAVSSWKVWETGTRPSFVLEVVSKDWEKDYVDGPLNHALAGTEELLIFDPHYTRRREGTRWQRFAMRDGRFQLCERTDGDRIHSAVLGCFLRAVGVGSALRVRIGMGPDGDELFPTVEESWEAERRAKEAERQAKEAERHAKEAERHAKEAERHAKEQAEERVAELERKLAELERKLS